MNPYSGETYASIEDAEKAGADTDALVWLTGKPEHVRAIADAVKAQRRKKDKAAKSRRRNR